MRRLQALSEGSKQRCLNREAGVRVQLSVSPRLPGERTMRLQAQPERRK